MPLSVAECSADLQRACGKCLISSSLLSQCLLYKIVRLSLQFMNRHSSLNRRPCAVPSASQPARLPLVLQGQIDERLRHLSFSSCAHVENVCRCVRGVVLGRRGDRSTAVVDTTVSRSTEFRRGMSRTIDGDDFWRETESIKCIFACCGVTPRGFTPIDPSPPGSSSRMTCVLSHDDVTRGSC